jgi:hypothetical protein
MPPLRLSVECYAGTFASIQSHFDQYTLERSLPALTVPALLVLGGASPIPTRHGVAWFRDVIRTNRAVRS